MKASVYLFRRAAKNAQLANNTWYPNKHNALVEFDYGRQSLVVTVMSVYGQVSTFVPVSTFDGDGPLSITVDARQLSKVARQLTGNIVKVEQSKDGLILSDEKASYLILPSDYHVAQPEYSETEIRDGFVIEDVKPFLREMQCSEQCSGSVLSLRCIYFRLSNRDQNIVVTGLDSFHIREMTLNAKVTGNRLLPIDKDNAKLIAGVFKGEDVISVKASETMMILESQAVKLICELMEVKMPNYSPYFEGKSVALYNVVTDAKRLYEASKRLSNFCAIMEIDFSEANFLRMTTDPNHFAGFDRVPYAIGDPPPFSILVNARYFADVLNGLEGNVKIEIGIDQLSPIIVRADGYRALLMPMRPKDENDEDEE
jgi:DNA polymerase III sliding clamp (beta) subunit (PCNA family)